MKQLILILLALLALLLLVACSAPRTGVVTSRVTAAIPGALGDDVSDDRIALQAALTMAAGSVLSIPAGRYLVSQAPLKYWALDIPAGTTVRCDPGAVLVQASGAGSSVRLLHVGSDGVTIEGCELDGNRANQTADEHRAGIFVEHAARVRIRNVTAHDFSGDGLVLHTGTSGAEVTGCMVRDNGRNGLTLSGAVMDYLIARNTLRGNRVQQLDHEPVSAAIGPGAIVGNVIDGSASGDYALTIAGGSPAILTHDITVAGNTITGGVDLVWASGVSLVGNQVTSASGKPAVTVYRATTNVTIERNQLSYTGTTNFGSVVLVQGTSGQGSAGTRIAGNVIANSNPHGLGLRVEGVSDVTIDSNTLTGSGVHADGYAGIALRATATDRDFVRATVTGNSVTGFGDAGLMVGGNGTARLLELELERNTFDSPAQTRGAVLDDGTGALRSLYAVDNTFGPLVLSRISRVPAACEIRASQEPP